MLSPDLQLIRVKSPRRWGLSFPVCKVGIMTRVIKLLEIQVTSASVSSRLPTRRLPSLPSPPRRPSSNPQPPLRSLGGGRLLRAPQPCGPGLTQSRGVAPSPRLAGLHSGLRPAARGRVGPPCARGSEPRSRGPTPGRKGPMPPGSGRGVAGGFAERGAREGGLKMRERSPSQGSREGGGPGGHTAPGCAPRGPATASVSPLPGLP